MGVLWNRRDLLIKRRLDQLLCNHMHVPQEKKNFLFLHLYLPVQDAQLIASKMYFFRLHYYQQ